MPSSMSATMANAIANTNSTDGMTLADMLPRTPRPLDSAKDPVGSTSTATAATGVIDDTPESLGKNENITFMKVADTADRPAKVHRLDDDDEVDEEEEEEEVQGTGTFRNPRILKPIIGGRGGLGEDDIPGFVLYSDEMLTLGKEKFAERYKDMLTAIHYFDPKNEAHKTQLTPKNRQIIMLQLRSSL